jgi:uracil-DNA glycosylase
MHSERSLAGLHTEIARCTVCAKDLPLGPRPVFRVSPTARILVIGQAPGRLVHASGVPWDDPSGKRLRQWMQVEDGVFYDSVQVGIMPMGFCYPGTGKSGDLPPRPECAPLWHEVLLAKMPAIELTLLIGQYAQNYYLQDRCKKTLTETVQTWREYAPTHLPLPHPSPRNNLWLKRNPWFEREVVPHLQDRIHSIL